MVIVSSCCALSCSTDLPSLAGFVFQLVEFLKKFHESREDEQFSDEKQYLIKQIQDLK